MTTTTTPTLSETRFAALKAKLRELFELDKADLDFGIYRIMAAKNKQVEAFLDHQLKDVVREVLEKHGLQAGAQIQADLNKILQRLKNDGLDQASIDAYPKVIELREKLAQITGGQSPQELEADIYNHLLNFFTRYYDEGDFISKRRYKGDTYAIPYNGEEVTLHWANKDQYYIKSGEWHKDYRFRVSAPTSRARQEAVPASGKAVRFKLVEATQETNNNKEADDAKRRYILSHDTPVVDHGSELELRFEFRVPTDDEKKAVDEAEATRIFGGKYDGKSSRTKGDEREQFCADAEQRAREAMPDAWLKLIAMPESAATDSKPHRTLLGKHLDTFTARNTYDYFIHKDLGGFLQRELDFYIKNEVVRLDDIESLDENHLARVQGRIKAIRRVAGRIIEFLAAIENFQKKLWLKKKFVLETNWLVTVDRIPGKIRDVVAENEQQWVEWERLGFKPTQTEKDELFKNVAWRSREYIDVHDKLIVDTRLFSSDFKMHLLADARVGMDSASLDEATTGTLIHGENFQAIGLLGSRLHSAVDAIYIDPPYNTGPTTIIYKNEFRDASWLSLMEDRICTSLAMLKPHGSYAIAIDDFEMVRLCEIVDEAMFGYDRSMIVVNHHPQGGMSNNVSRTHEYMLVMTPVGQDILQGKAKEDGVEYRSFMLSGPGANKSRTGRPNSFYALLIDEQQNKIVGVEPSPNLVEEYPKGKTDDGHARRYPISPSGEEKVWCRAYESAVESLEKGEIVISEGGTIKLAVRTDGKRKNLMSNWTASRYNAGPHGTALVASMMWTREAFSYPKSLYTVIDAVEAMTHMNNRAVIMDFLADQGRRRMRSLK